MNRFWKLGALLALNAALALVVVPTAARAGGGGGGGACSLCYEYVDCGHIGPGELGHSFWGSWCENGGDPEESRRDSHDGLFENACTFDHPPYFHSTCG